MHERQSSAEPVALEDGTGREYIGTTTGMTADIPSSLMQCSVPTAGPDAVWSFSLAAPMDVEVTADGWGDGAALALFDSPIERPSVSVRRSLAAARVQLYDIDHLPDQPEPGCAAVRLEPAPLLALQHRAHLGQRARDVRRRPASRS